jgi:hypothetical protein
LALVRGREQMTLRVLGAAAPRPVPAAPLADAAGPGTRYLLGRRDILALAESVPELEPLRPGLAALVRAERRERHDQPPLLASIHHLVDRGGAAAYRAAVRRGRAAVAPRQVLVRGPWPPYAFATGLGLGGTP